MPDALDTLVAAQLLCNFTESDGRKCASDKVLARGYCERHYRQLKRAGAFDALALQDSTKRGMVKANARAVIKARKKLLRLAPDYVDLHLAASKIAAQKGESKAIEWALLHTRTVEPVATTVAPAAVTSPTINIGVRVSGTSDKVDTK